MTAAHLAKALGLTVIATTRNAAKAEALSANGADQVVIDQGAIAPTIHERFPEGVDRVLELVGTTTLLDSLQCATSGGIVCMTGILGNAWALNNFSPMNDIPHTVRLTVYTGESKDLSVEQLQRFIDSVAAGQSWVNIDRTFHLGEIVAAHQYMESNQAKGKLVVLVNEP